MNKQHEYSTRHAGRVLVFREDILPISETFILEQVLSLERWNAWLVGDFASYPSLDTSGVNVFMRRNGMIRPHGILKYINIIDRKLIKSGLQEIRKIGAQVAHVHFGVDAVNYWGLLKTLDIPVLITLHGYDINTNREYWESGKSGFSMKSYPAKLLEISRDPRVRFIAVSEAVKCSAIKFGIREDALEVCYIGIDPYKFLPSAVPMSRRKDVLFVGRLVEKKGCRYLLEAFRRIQDRFPESNLVIAGSGPQEVELKSLSINEGIRARFLGSVSSQHVRELLGTARVFCLPSVTATNGDAEGFGLVILEAMASGVPVITSARGGAVEGVVNGVTGFSHQECAVDEIENYLHLLLNDYDMAESFGKNGRARVLSRFNIKSCTRDLECLYDKAAK